MKPWGNRNCTSPRVSLTHALTWGLRSGQPQLGRDSGVRLVGVILTLNLRRTGLDGDSFNSVRFSLSQA